MMRFVETTDPASVASDGKDTVLICGMPGIGSVGKIVVESLKSHFKASLLVSIFFDDFPSQVIVGDEGTLSLPSVQLFHAPVSEKTGMLLLTGDFQPTSNLGIYNFIDKFWDYLTGKGIRISLIVSTGAYVPEQIPMQPKVFVSGTDKETMQAFIDTDPAKVQTMEGGIITGANGVFPAWGIMVDVPGTCILAETIPMVKKDPKAAKILVELLGRKFGFEPDLSDLQRMADDMDMTIEELKKRAGIMPEPKEHGPERDSHSYIG